MIQSILWPSSLSILETALPLLPRQNGGRPLSSFLFAWVAVLFFSISCPGHAEPKPKMMETRMEIDEEAYEAYRQRITFAATMTFAAVRQHPEGWKSLLGKRLTILGFLVPLERPSPAMVMMIPPPSTDNWPVQALDAVFSPGTGRSIFHLPSSTPGDPPYRWYWLTPALDLASLTPSPGALGQIRVFGQAPRDYAPGDVHQITGTCRWLAPHDEPYLEAEIIDRDHLSAVRFLPSWPTRLASLTVFDWNLLARLFGSPEEAAEPFPRTTSAGSLTPDLQKLAGQTVIVGGYFWPNRLPQHQGDIVLSPWQPIVGGCPCVSRNVPTVRESLRLHPRVPFPRMLTGGVFTGKLRFEPPENWNSALVAVIDDAELLDPRWYAIERLAQHAWPTP